MHLQMTPEEQLKIHQWLQTDVYPEIAVLQKAAGGQIASMVMETEQGIYPYFGAIGGDVTFHITPTSIGTVYKAKVQYGEKSYELDLTNYEEW